MAKSKEASHPYLLPAGEKEKSNIQGEMEGRESSTAERRYR